MKKTQQGVYAGISSRFRNPSSQLTMVSVAVGGIAIPNLAHMADPRAFWLVAACLILLAVVIAALLIQIRRAATECKLATIELAINFENEAERVRQVEEVADALNMIAMFSEAKKLTQLAGMLTNIDTDLEAATEAEKQDAQSL